MSERYSALFVTSWIDDDGHREPGGGHDLCGGGVLADVLRRGEIHARSIGLAKEGEFVLVDHVLSEKAGHTVYVDPLALRLSLSV